MDEKDPDEFIYAAVFIVLFVPPFAFMLLQITRAVQYISNRNALHKFLWIKWSDGERINVHLVVKLAFAGICALRVLQGILFLIELSISSSEEKHREIDNVIRYYIPYIAINLMFSAVSVLLFYWLELGLAAALDLDSHTRIIPKKIIWAIVGINVLFHLLTIILLPAFIRPTWESTQIQSSGSVKTFRIEYFFCVSVPMLVLVSFGNAWIRYSVKRLRKKMTQEQLQQMKLHIEKAYRKMGWFIVVVVAAFAVRVFFDFGLIFTTLEEEVAALLSFVWNSIPELALSIAFIWLTWIKKSKLVPTAAEKETLLSDHIAPEIDFDAPEEMNQ